MVIFMYCNAPTGITIKLVIISKVEVYIHYSLSLNYCRMFFTIFWNLISMLAKKKKKNRIIKLIYLLESFIFLSITSIYMSEQFYNMIIIVIINIIKTLANLHI